MGENGGMTETTQLAMIGELRKVLKRLHYPLEVMLVCARWYAAYPLSFLHLEEMMQERGVFVDHSTVHRWSLKILPVLALIFRRRSDSRSIGRSSIWWRLGKTTRAAAVLTAAAAFAQGAAAAGVGPNRSPPSPRVESVASSFMSHQRANASVAVGVIPNLHKLSAQQPVAHVPCS
jgi:hypothetical protein